MSVEIERKYLVKRELLPKFEKSHRMVQAYLCVEPERTVRVRIIGQKAFLTIKGGLKGISRLECEYEIPVDDANQLLELAVSSPVEKVRHEIWYNTKLWEVDVFEGKNKGLCLAEIELKSEDEQFDLPDWVSEEVTHDMRYHNSQLSQNPYSTWE